MCSENGFEADRSDAVRALSIVFTTLGGLCLTLSLHVGMFIAAPYVEKTPPNMETTVQYISATNYRLGLFLVSLLALLSHLLKILLK